MKIHGPHQSHFDLYNNQAKKMEKTKNEHINKDRLEISNRAKHLQQSEKSLAKREKYVQNIKDAIDSGEYKINYGKTAKKMINFWKGQ